MPGSISRPILAGSAGMALAALFGVLLVGCKHNSTGAADAAVDAPQGSTSTSTGTGSASLTGTGSDPRSNTATGGRTIGASSTLTSAASLTSTARDTGIGSGVSGTGVATAMTTSTSALTGLGWTPFTVPLTGRLTGVITGTAVITATATPTQTVQGIASGTMVYTNVIAVTNTETKTVTYVCYPAAATAASTGTWTDSTTDLGRVSCATWNTIQISRRNGLGFCPMADSAASAVITRGADGELTLSGKAFRDVPGESKGCLSLTISNPEVCRKEMAFAETKLTPAQRDQLNRLVASLPPVRCTPDGRSDPCVLTTLSIDSFSIENVEMRCWGETVPGTQLPGVHAIVAFIDSLVPKQTLDSADGSVSDAQADLR